MNGTTKLASGPRRLTVWAIRRTLCSLEGSKATTINSITWYRGIYMARTNTLHTPCIYSRKIHSPAFHNITGIARRLLVRCWAVIPLASIYFGASPTVKTYHNTCKYQYCNSQSSRGKSYSCIDNKWWWSCHNDSPANPLLATVLSEIQIHSFTNFIFTPKIRTLKPSVIHTSIEPFQKPSQHNTPLCTPFLWKLYVN